MGYPALVLDAANRIAVQILESESLPEHWERLDEFEGPAYQRVITTAITDDGEFEVSVYVASDI